VLCYLLASPDIDRITYLYVEYVGPERLYIVAAVDMAGDDAEHSLAVRLRRLERKLEQHEAIEEVVLTLATPNEVRSPRSPLRDVQPVSRSIASFTSSTQ
jgi:hypothetical protein